MIRIFDLLKSTVRQSTKDVDRNRMNISSLSAREKLRIFLEQFSGDDKILILINADPDAIACAMAVKRLLWRKTSGVKISRINTMNRPDNLAMVRLLRVNLTHVRKITKSMYSKVVMVDSQPDHSPLFEKFSPHMIIDHHPDTGCSAPVTDIRPAYGATASMMTEYLRATGIKPSEKLATGLFHAIKTDTNNFQRKTIAEDLRAFQFLFKHINPALARRIDQAELRIDYLDYFNRAINGYKIRKGRLFCHLGKISTPDICVLIADFFMRIESVNWSIVSGFNGKKLIIIFRNDGIRKNAGTLAKQSFCRFGSAGGHKSAARAEIEVQEIASLVEIDDNKKSANWIINQIEKRARKTNA